MNVRPLQEDEVQEVRRLMELGAPYISARTLSDYWLYAHLFSSTCPVAHVDGAIAGAVIAFRSQDKPDDIYVQDVMIHPDHRRRGIASALIDSVRAQGHAWGCRRLYLTSEPDNTAAHRSWTAMGFDNAPGDKEVNGVQVTSDFKGPDRDRAVYQLMLA